MSTVAVERVESAQPQYLTVAEVASLLRVHEKTIVRLALRDASMPALRLGRILRFEQGALRRWLASKGSQKNHRSGS